MTPDNERLNKYWRYIRAIFTADGLQTADCDDLVQETYVRIAKQLSKGVTLPDSDDALKSWLATHARWQRNDYWRNLKGRGEKGKPTVVHFGSAEPVQTDTRGRGLPHWFAGSQDGEIRWKELLDVIRLEICEKAALSVDLWRRKYTQTEIAKTLNVDVKTVARYLAKAREIASRDL